MGNKIVTEADRKFTPQPKPLSGTSVPTSGRGQRVSLELVGRLAPLRVR